MLGGGPDATEADPDAVDGHEMFHAMVELMRADHGWVGSPAWHRQRRRPRRSRRDGELSSTQQRL